MSTLTISLDDSLARQIEESARREQKSVSDWISERIRLDAERMAALESSPLRREPAPHRCSRLMATEWFI